MDGVGHESFRIITVERPASDKCRIAVEWTASDRSGADGVGSSTVANRSGADGVGHVSDVSWADIHRFVHEV